MAPLTIVEANPPKFDAAFLDRRMRAHRDWQEQLAVEAAAEIISEVASAIQHIEQLRAGCGPTKIASPKKLRENV